MGLLLRNNCCMAVSRMAIQTQLATRAARRVVARAAQQVVAQVATRVARRVLARAARWVVAQMVARSCCE